MNTDKRKTKTAPGNKIVAAVRKNPNAFKPLVDALKSIDSKDVKVQRPILCKDSVALNIREGRQTQHRVPMKPQPSSLTRLDRYCFFTGNPIFGDGFCPNTPWSVGDLLWVRESATVYRISGNRVKFIYEADQTWGKCKIPERIKGLKVGNMMPNKCFKEASRTWVKVTRVWVERVQGISEEDTKKEGVSPACEICRGGTCVGSNTHLMGFENLWNSIYGKPKEGKHDYSWNANPWVWCCEFERVDR